MSLVDFLLEYLICPWDKYEDFEIALSVTTLLLFFLVVLDTILVIRNKMKIRHYGKFVFAICSVANTLLFVLFFWYVALPLSLTFLLIELHFGKISVKMMINNGQTGESTIRSFESNKDIFPIMDSIDHEQSISQTRDLFPSLKFIFLVYFLTPILLFSIFLISGLSFRFG